MLVLSRKVGERIVIDGNISVVINRVAGNRITLGIDAPKDVRVVRGELADQEKAEEALEETSEESEAFSAVFNGQPITFDFSDAPMVQRAR
jgi:carbon storage regulator